MLTLTDDACLIIKAIAARTGGGREAGGIRISDGSTRGTDFAIDLADGPVEGDLVVERRGARVFVEPSVADDLDTSALDAGVSDEGLVDFSIGAGEQQRPEGMTEVRGTGAGH